MTAARLLCDVRAVFFDAVGTVIYPEPSAAEVYADVGRRFGSRLPRDGIRSRFAAAFRRQEQADANFGWRTGEEREVERWRCIVAEVLDDVSDTAACFQALYAHFGRPAAWRCGADAAETLNGLAAQGYVLGLASNFDRRLRSVVAGLPIQRYITQFVISSEVGWRKPSIQFFGALCRQVRLPPAQVLLVGDDVANDFEGAQAAGLAAVLFDPQGKGPANVAPRIGRLDQLRGD